MSETDFPDDWPQDVPLLHDTFFQETFQMRGVAYGFLKHVLPKRLLAQLLLEKLTIEVKKFVDEQFKESRADVVYRIPVKGTDTMVSVYVIVEHKSTNDFWTVFQLWRYVVRICEREVQVAGEKKRLGSKFRLPPIIPVIVHQGNSGFTGPTQLFEVFRKMPGVKKFVPKMQAILFDLTTIDDDKLPCDPNVPELHVVLKIMKVVFRKDVGIKVKEVLEELKPYSDIPKYRRLIRMLVLYVVYNARKMTKPDYVQLKENVVNTVGVKNMPTLIEIFRAEGKIEGWEEGKAEGKARGLAEGKARGLAEGKAEAIISVLKIRFANVPRSLEDSIFTISDFSMFEDLTRIAVTCGSLDEFAVSLKSK